MKKAAFCSVQQRGKQPPVQFVHCNNEMWGQVVQQNSLMLITYCITPKFGWSLIMLIYLPENQHRSCEHLSSFQQNELWHSGFVNLNLLKHPNTGLQWLQDMAWKGNQASLRNPTRNGGPVTFLLGDLEQVSLCCSVPQFPSAENYTNLTKAKSPHV